MGSGLKIRAGGSLFSNRCCRMDSYDVRLSSLAELVSNGRLTDKGLAELRQRVPHTDLTQFEKNPDINKLADLFTVNAIVNYVDSRLNAA